jgi:hypothetical protein
MVINAIVSMNRLDRIQQNPGRHDGNIEEIQHHRMLWNRLRIMSKISYQRRFRVSRLRRIEFQGKTSILWICDLLCD